MSGDYEHYARMLVDIDLSKPPPDSLQLNNDGYKFYIYFEYENLPAFCTVCSLVGHTFANYHSLRHKESNTPWHPPKDHQVYQPKQPIEDLNKPQEKNPIKETKNQSKNEENEKNTQEPLIRKDKQIDNKEQQEQDTQSQHNEDIVDDNIVDLKEEEPISKDKDHLEETHDAYEPTKNSNQPKSPKLDGLIDSSMTS